MSSNNRADSAGWRGTGDNCVDCKTDLRGRVAWVSHRAIQVNGTWAMEGSVYCGLCFTKTMWGEPSSAVLRKAEKERPLPELLLPS